MVIGDPDISSVVCIKDESYLSVFLNMKNINSLFIQWLGQNI